MKRILLFVLAAVLALPAAFAQSDGAIQAAAQRALSAPYFKHVRASVQNGVVTLSGSVDLYQVKADALLKAGLVPGVREIRNEIRVDTPSVPDRKLRAGLDDAILRLGHPIDAPQGISVDAKDGVITLSGYTANLAFATAVAAVAANTRGVRDLVDHIHVISGALATEWPSAALDLGSH